MLIYLRIEQHLAFMRSIGAKTGKGFFEVSKETKEKWEKNKIDRK